MEHRVTTMCRLYGVTRAGDSAWRDRAPSARAKANHRLLQRIEHIHRRSHGTYGSPRVVQVLHQYGIATSEKRVARLMRAAGLTGRVVRVTRRAPGVHRFFEATGNLRVATAAPTAANQEWVGMSPSSRPTGVPVSWPPSWTSTRGASWAGRSGRTGR